MTEKWIPETPVFQIETNKVEKERYLTRQDNTIYTHFQ